VLLLALLGGFCAGACRVGLSFLLCRIALGISLVLLGLAFADYVVTTDAEPATSLALPLMPSAAPLMPSWVRCCDRPLINPLSSFWSSNCSKSRGLPDLVEDVASD
jgi:hypothetical protein